MKNKISFEDLLPPARNSFQAGFRAKIIEILNTDGEILPAADTPLGQLWNLVNSDNSSVEDCIRVIELDPALTTRIFRVANSVAYNARASNISEAVMHIGLSKVRELAFSASIFDQFSRLKLPPGWDHFWMRNILIARLSERIASSCFRTNGTEYLAGLLHDTGWIFVVTFFPNEFNLIMAGPRPIAEAEKELLPFTHADISAAICSRSLLPLRVANAVIYHHSPMFLKVNGADSLSQSARFLGVILHLADKLADASKLQILEQKDLTVDEIENSEEAKWLASCGAKVDFRGLIAEELPKAQEIFSIFFAGS